VTIDWNDLKQCLGSELEKGELGATEGRV